MVDNLLPQPIVHSREAALDPDQYPLHAEVDRDHWWWRARRDILDAVLRRYAPPGRDGRRLLAEIGCGAGGNLGMLAQHGEVFGAEPFPDIHEHLEGLRPEGVRILQHAIPEPLPEPVDVICLFDVLEHLDDDRGTMEWIASQLRPDGIAVITVPALQFLWCHHDDAAHHKRRYSRSSLRALLPPTLTCVHDTYFNSLLFPPISAFKIGLKLLGSSGGATTHIGLPPRLINEVLYRGFRSERHLVASRRLPIGVSLLLVARRTDVPG